LLCHTKSYVLRMPDAYTSTSHGGGPKMSAALWQEPSKPVPRTSATSMAADSGCSCIVPNSLPEVFGAPAPVLPPWVM
jgi:hypothetical protein